MEGISHEACSLAGTLRLGKLIALYDDNRISIDSEKGSIDQWFTDDTPARFEAYGWRVIPGVDGHDPQAVDAAIRLALSAHDRPTLICCKTVIGKGSPKKANTGGAHGAPLGADEVAATRQAIGWLHPPFEIPADIREAWDGRQAGAAREQAWQARFDAYRAAHPELAAAFEARMRGELPGGWPAAADAFVAAVAAKGENIATRKASQNALDGFGPHLPGLVGGSADLAASNLTWWKGSRAVGTAGGNYLFFGVREFGMAAIMNGLALHGGFIPYGGTFLVFSDYSRNALRLAALMRLRVIHVLTHDSIGLGEDGPTHQPVEHAAALRVIPGMAVWRPCDAVETAVAWRSAIERTDGPAALLLSRQNLPHQARDTAQVAAIARGGYVLADAEGGTPQVVIIATGSEVALATGARALLAAQGVRALVVSMPSTTVFDAQDAAWKASVLPPGVPRVAVEAGVTDGWYKYVGLDGAVVGLDRFGESAPGPELFKFFGFTAEHVAEVALGVARR
jgi:transketolase